MAFFQYLVFDGENLPLPDSYEGSWRMWKRIPAVRQRQGQHRGGCGAAWCGADPGVVFRYGEVVEEAGGVCEEG